jgi:hypothetical protein
MPHSCLPTVYLHWTTVQGSRHKDDSAGIRAPAAGATPQRRSNSECLHPELISWAPCPRRTARCYPRPLAATARTLARAERVSGVKWPNGKLSCGKRTRRPTTACDRTDGRAAGQRLRGGECRGRDRDLRRGPVTMRSPRVRRPAVDRRGGRRDVRALPSWTAWKLTRPSPGVRAEAATQRHRAG